MLIIRNTGTAVRKEHRKPASWILKCYGDNLPVFFAFEVVYAACLLAGLYPMVRVVISWIMRITGFGYLTAENSGKFLHNPGALLLFTAAVVLWTLVPFGGIFGVADLSERSSRGIRCSVDGVVRRSARNTLRVFRKENLLMLVFFIPVALLTHLANVIRFAWNFLPASFWKSITHKHPWLYALMGVAILLLVWIFVRLRYVFPIWSMGGTGALQAAALSWKSTSSDVIASMLRFLGIHVQLFGIYAAALIFLTIVITLGGNFLHAPGENTTSVIVVVQKICFSIYDMVISPIVFTRICNAYFSEAIGKVQYSRALRQGRKRGKKKKRVSGSLVLLLVSAASLAFYVYGSARGRYHLRIEGIEAMQITAHRGASMQRPENTMAAFAEAAEQGADWIELDVHESADGMIFVMHDSNFLRTTGYDANVWELTWKEISELDAGHFFSPDYAGEKIPLLSEVLAFASENGLNLNIELKPTGHEKNLVESVISLIQEYEYEENCVVTSQSYAAVEKVRECSDRIRTVYVSGLAYGAVNRMTAADAFSVQSVSISRSLVRNLHNRGIEVYAWTVDSRKNINRMIDYGVDNIITNNVPLARKCISESQTSGLTGELIRSLNSLFT